jgi:hypothetical protein
VDRFANSYDIVILVSIQCVYKIRGPHGHRLPREHERQERKTAVFHDGIEDIPPGVLLFAWRSIIDGFGVRVMLFVGNNVKMAFQHG